MPGGEQGWVSALSRVMAQLLNAKFGASKLGGGALGGDGCSGRHLVVFFQPGTRLRVLAQPLLGSSSLNSAFPGLAVRLLGAGNCSWPCEQGGFPWNVLSHCLQG